MKFSQIKKVFCLAIWVIPLFASSQTFRDLDKVFKSEMDNGFNGNVLYSKDDAVLYTGNFGIINYRSRLPLNDSTIFNLASCSKQFTALAIMQLVEKGKLSLDTKVDEVLNFPYREVTIQQLLNHTSGLPDYMDFEDYADDIEILTNAHVLDYIRHNQPQPNFSPGKQFEYSNTGYLVLGSIIEEVTGLSFASYLKENIFEPTGMKNSLVLRRRYEPQRIDNCTEGHVFSNNIYMTIPIDDDPDSEYVKWFDGIVGDGTVNSTILDMEKWKRALRNNKLITEESKQMMFEVGGAASDYGFGFRIETDKWLGKMITHSGSWGGYRSLTMYLPKTNEYFVLLGNTEYEEMDKLLNEMIEITGEMAGAGF
ncbi:MAG: beta-lactamase family protein [Cyclobacteriaceae bacterium]